MNIERDITQLSFDRVRLTAFIDKPKLELADRFLQR
ncbi:Uncharacterised protein [Vibrio cholerae]|nr:Uncharacterised protein [Vibrio cholerae]CSB76909.1 Uncharacterised protein [Vibrio cholerae]CSI41246.1 Uncharacterised protein [Vibrio cholerae]